MGIESKKRNRIIINFRETEQELELFERLLKHSNPASYIKDVFMGLVPLILDNGEHVQIVQNGTNSTSEKSIEKFEEEEEILDVDNILEFIDSE